MARRVTCAEMQDKVLAPLIPKWRELAREHPNIYKGGVHISWDKAPWHRRHNVLDECKDLKFNFLPVPTLGSDFNRVIEHVINDVKSAATAFFNDHPEICKMQDIMHNFKRMFFEHVKAQGVRRDIKALPLLYDKVANPKKKGGVEGGWPPKKFR